MTGMGATGELALRSDGGPYRWASWYKALSLPGAVDAMSVLGIDAEERRRVTWADESRRRLEPAIKQFELDSNTDPVAIALEESLNACAAELGAQSTESVRFWGALPDVDRRYSFVVESVMWAIVREESGPESLLVQAKAILDCEATLFADGVVSERFLDGPEIGNIRDAVRVVAAASLAKILNDTSQGDAGSIREQVIARCSELMEPAEVSAFLGSRYQAFAYWCALFQAKLA